MSSHELSRTQRLFTSLVDAPTAAAMEAHSRAWLVRCLNCSHVRSIWELGGIRYKASGNSLTRLRCPTCGKAAAHRLEKAEDFPATSVPAGSLWRAILSVTLGLTLVFGAMAALIVWLVGGFG